MHGHRPSNAHAHARASCPLIFEDHLIGIPHRPNMHKASKKKFLRDSKEKKRQRKKKGCQRSTAKASDGPEGSPMRSPQTHEAAKCSAHRGPLLGGLWFGDPVTDAPPYQRTEGSDHAGPETAAAWENTLVHAHTAPLPPSPLLFTREFKKFRKKRDYRIGKFSGRVRHAGGRFESCCCCCCCCR